MPLLFTKAVRLQYLVYILFGFIGLVLSIQVRANNGEVTVIKHYDKGYSPLLRVYLTDVLKTALDKTVSEYGPYKLHFYSRFLSSNRSKLETERGVLVDVLFSSHWRGNFVNPSNVIQIEFPVFDGMLGLRSLIVTGQQGPIFSHIQSSREFKQYVAGQGSNWVDVEVLRDNGIPVVEAQLFDGLFPMLSKSRFNYLPLSILEAQTALQTKGVQYDDLTIQRDLSIFYPIPFYLFVNAEKPELAERLQKGLTKALEDGSIERLFGKHFYYVQSTHEENTKKLIIVDSPLITQEKNRELVDRFLQKYQQYFEILP